jgi:hypothetical protein
MLIQLYTNICVLRGATRNKSNVRLTLDFTFVLVSDAPNSHAAFLIPFWPTAFTDTDPGEAGWDFFVWVGWSGQK